MAVELLTPAAEPEYLNYVQNHPRGTLEFLLGWRDLLQKHFKFKPFYLVRRNVSGSIDGVLPLFLARGIFGRRLVSIPYAVSAGILADSPQAAHELVSAAEALARKEKVKFMEIREPKIEEGPTLDKRDPSSFSSSEQIFSFSLSLNPDVKSVWKKLPKGSIRWGIKKAEKSGLTCSYGNSPQYLDDFYQLFLHTRKHRGVPAYPYAYLQGILNVLGDNARIYIAYHNHQPVAGILLLYYKHEVRYAFAGAIPNPKLLQLQPYHLLLWQAIQDACGRGYTTFNFGGAATTTNDGGLYDFKSKWADKITPVSSSMYTPHRNYTPIPGATSGSIPLKIAGKVWRHLPIPIIKVISPYVIRQFV